jgi:MarR family transcriptional regulator, organic hydroperoxide resistance regulator
VASTELTGDQALAKPTLPSPYNWIAEETGRSDPASQAWSLLHWLMITSKARFLAINQEFDLAPQQAIALRILGGGPQPMGALAGIIGCDSSNITGITDRLEERGLVRRTSAEHDRRVKLLVLTDEGERVRAELTKLLAEPPPAIAELSERDQRDLRDILQRAAASERDESQKDER